MSVKSVAFGVIIVMGKIEKTYTKTKCGVPVEQTYTLEPALNNMYENMSMKALAKEILLEENYVRYIKSYYFTFWAQILGILAGFLIPMIIFSIYLKDIENGILAGAGFGSMWMILWIPGALLLPQTRIYRQFAKWYRDDNSQIYELNLIFKK